jgi:hypothetical protein
MTLMDARPELDLSQSPIEIPKLFHQVRCLIGFKRVLVNRRIDPPRHEA